MCTSPLYKIDFDRRTWKCLPNGKIDPRSKFKIINRAEYDLLVKGDISDMTVTQIGCGQCIECRIQKAREWAVRLYCESLCHDKDSCWFITLTYAPENLPKPFDTFNRVNYKRGMYSSLCKDEVSTFMKNLRNKFGPGIRFFACGEYMPNRDPNSSQLHAPHYHLCVFGLKNLDLKFLYAKKGHLYFNSDSIDKIWKKGFVVISDFSSTNAQYTAQYCVKKFTGKKNNDYYELCFNSQVKPLSEEFILMSRRPGIGLNYLNSHKDELLSSKLIYMREGKSAMLPRYFKNKLFDDDEIDRYGLELEISAAYKKLYENKQTDKSDLDRLADREALLEKHSIGKRQMQ